MRDRAPLTYINLREIQVNVIINSNLLLDRAPFYHFIVVSENLKKACHSF